MLDRKNKNIIIFTIMILYILIYRFFIFENIVAYSETITAAFMIILIPISIILFGYKKDKDTYLKKYVQKNTLFYVLITFAIVYALGFFTGFLKNAYSLRLEKIFENTLAPIIIIISTEFIRYIILTSNKDKKNVPIILTIILILLELVITIRPVDNMQLRELFEIVTATILPIIIKNCTLSYLTYQVGMRSSLTYRGILDLYVYILPVFPNLGDYLNSMILISLPILVYISSAKIIDEYRDGVKHDFTKGTFKVYDIPVIVFLVILIALASGYFEYHLIGIGSNSMKPKISRGDAIIIDKIHSKSELKVGQVIAYRKDNMIVVHRLYKIKKNGNKTYYVTKGDVNATADDIKIKYKDIEGIVRVKIPYVAYPSVLLNEIFNKEE